MYKYADDTALVGLCTNTDTQCRAEVDRFVSWCYDNFLNLNVDKTKEMIIDYRRNNNEHNVLEINEKVVQTVQEYNYLGTVIDNKLCFESNVHALYIIPGCIS